MRYRPTDDSFFKNVLSVIGLGEYGFTSIRVSSVELDDIPSFVKAALSNFPNRTELLVVNQAMSYNMNLSATDAVSTLYAKINDTNIPPAPNPMGYSSSTIRAATLCWKTMPVFWMSTNLLVEVYSMCVYLFYCIPLDSCSSWSHSDPLWALSFVLGHLQNKCGHRQHA